MAWPRSYILAAALLGGTGILIAAAGAHMGGLSDAGRTVIERASYYQLIHAGMLFVIAQHFRPVLHIPAFCFIAGSVLFCGGIYLRHVAGNDLLAPLVPAGGSMFALGWFSLALSAFRRG